MKDLNLLTLHETSRGWPLRCLKIPEAHGVTRGREDLIVAVIDLGYSYHPQHEGYLWRNPELRAGGVSGWDCHDDDASLEYTGHDPETPYHRGHHAFIVGEVIMCVPDCRVMNVRVGYGNNDSWWRGIDFAVEHGAKVLIMPHGYLPRGPANDAPMPLFYSGSDFSYPYENPGIRKSLDAAYDAGCLICKGTADNRGRRVATVNAALESVMAVGSSNRRNQAADIAASADYVEVATPGGERSSKDTENEHVWSTGGFEDFMSFTGGCMASGFVGGVAALAWSQFPELSNRELRQVLRNTAQGAGWDPLLGYGVLDAHRAVSLRAEDLCRRVHVVPQGAEVTEGRDARRLSVTVRNSGVFDAERVLVVAFNGDPRVPAVPDATRDKPVLLVTRQIGHAVARVRGLHDTRVEIDLIERPEGEVWVEAVVLDLHGSAYAETVRVLPAASQVGLT